MAANSRRYTPVAAMRPRVDSREVDVCVDGPECGAQRRQDDQYDQPDRQHVIRNVPRHQGDDADALCVFVRGLLSPVSRAR